MKEPVGECIDCRKIVYCDGGFLDGIVLKDHSIRCYDCDEKLQKEEINQDQNKK